MFYCVIYLLRMCEILFLQTYLFYISQLLWLRKQEFLFVNYLFSFWWKYGLMKTNMSLFKPCYDCLYHVMIVLPVGWTVEAWWSSNHPRRRSGRESDVTTNRQTCRRICDKRKLNGSHLCSSDKQGETVAQVSISLAFHTDTFPLHVGWWVIIMYALSIHLTLKITYKFSKPNILLRTKTWQMN